MENQLSKSTATDGAGGEIPLYHCFGHVLASTTEIGDACKLVCKGLFRIRQLQNAHVNAVSLQNEEGNVGALQLNAILLVCPRCHVLCDKALIDFWGTWCGPCSGDGAGAGAGAGVGAGAGAGGGASSASGGGGIGGAGGGSETAYFKRDGGGGDGGFGGSAGGSATAHFKSEGGGGDGGFGGGGGGSANAHLKWEGGGGDHKARPIDLRGGDGGEAAMEAKALAKALAVSAAEAMENELKEVDLEEEEEIVAHTEAIRQLQEMTVAVQRRAAARRIEIRERWFDAAMIPLSDDEQDYIDL